jgi:hypothetical protein
VQHNSMGPPTAAAATSPGAASANVNSEDTNLDLDGEAKLKGGCDTWCGR